MISRLETTVKSEMGSHPPRVLHSGGWLCQGRVENSEWVLPAITGKVIPDKILPKDTPTPTSPAANLRRDSRSPIPVLSPALKAGGIAKLLAAGMKRAPGAEETL
jgi:hypothetical protein